MRFSIVIPVYNVETYIPYCFASVIKQDFTDFEVVLVNDGSTDGSANICRHFCESSGLRVTYVEQENKGLLAARRAGFAASQGDYLISLDSDDALRADALKVINQSISETFADVIMFGYSRSPHFDEVFTAPLKPNCLYGPSDFRRIFCSDNSMNAIWLKAVARKCMAPDCRFEKYGRLNMGEDAIQSALIFDRAKTVYSISEALYFYRPNEKSISSIVDASYLEDMSKVHACLTEYAAKWDKMEEGAPCMAALQPRCAEESCHFVLHHLSNCDFRQAQVFLERVSSSGCIEYCRRNPDSILALPLHTRIISHLIIKRQFRAVWAATKLLAFAIKGRR